MKLQLYDENNHRLVFDRLKYWQSGSSGSIYKLDANYLLKYINDGYCYDVEAIKAINDMNLPNFAQLYQLFYGENYQFCGYTTKYYETEVYDILTMPTEYTIENFNRLIKSANKITQEGIFISDMHDGNAILERDIIRIIDYDLFRYSEQEHKVIEKYNCGEIIYLFKCLYMSALKDYHMVTPQSSTRINELFLYGSEPSEAIKKLVKYKYPIDYVK